MWPTKICFLFYLYFDELPSQKVILIYTSTCSMWNYMLGCIYTSIAAAAAKSLQSCQTLCDSIDSSPPGSPIPGILQARILEWVAISFSNAWKWKVKVKSLSHVRLFATPWTAAHQAPPPWDSPGKSTGVGCHCLLQWVTKLNGSFSFNNHMNSGHCPCV